MDGHKRIIDVNEMYEACDSCERNNIINSCGACIYKELKQQLDMEKNRALFEKKQKGMKTQEMI